PCNIRHSSRAANRRATAAPIPIPPPVMIETRMIGQTIGAATANANNRHGLARNRDEEQDCFVASAFVR
ncbi:MAG TPA: hypothetical protein VEN78_04490, partial [Bradyrhizobium sp.]|nr:hypothetical protein [Bradyrhizobium sp.]